MTTSTYPVRRFVCRVETVREGCAEGETGPRVGSLLRTADRVAYLFRFLRGRPAEEFHVAMLDAKHRLISSAHISTGTMTMSLVHPREVFRPAIQTPGCVALIAVHNHPSGDPEPSAEDRQVTRRLLDGGVLLGIPLLDHVVLGDPGHVSLRDRMSFS